MKGNKTMRFEIELPENYDDIISITAIGAKAGVTKVACNTIAVRGHNGKLLIIPETGRARWETPIMLNKTMEQIVKKEKEKEEQAKIGKAWENIKKLMGEKDFNEVEMLIKEAFKKACDK